MLNGQYRIVRHTLHFAYGVKVLCIRDVTRALQRVCTWYRAGKVGRFKRINFRFWMETQGSVVIKHNGHEIFSLLEHPLEPACV